MECYPLVASPVMARCKSFTQSCVFSKGSIILLEQCHHEWILDPVKSRTALHRLRSHKSQRTPYLSPWLLSSTSTCCTMPRESQAPYSKEEIGRASCRE